MAPNEIMGEVEFTVDGARYVFALNTFARLQLQKTTGKSFNQYFASVDPQAFGDLQLVELYTAGLLQRHDLDEMQICTLLDQLGRERAQEIIVEALKLVFPKITEVAKSNGNFPTANPTNGTGIGSLPNG
jgi:hypothetical protein